MVKSNGLKGQRDDPNNYHPIALVNVIVKLFTHIICRRLTRWAEANSLLSKFQSGFRAGRGCIDNIFVLNPVIQSALNEAKGRLFALFVDFRREFPSILHALLWFELRHLGVSSQLVKTLISLYSSALMFLKDGASLSDGVDIGEASAGRSPQSYSLCSVPCGPGDLSSGEGSTWDQH